MHILYVHQNFPAQFGHIARHLVRQPGWRCTFVSETAAGQVEGIEKIQYKTKGGATKTTHFCSRTFENAVWHTDAVYNALKARPDIQPDLIVGHSGFGSTLFLSEVYPDTPIVNFFEYYYRAHDPDSDMDFRQDLNWDVPEVKYLRSRCRNAMILLDLQNCDAAYTPTQFQKSRFPAEYQSGLEVIFDGVDRSVYHGHDEALRPAPGTRGVRTIAGREVGPDTRVVTYVSRGFESMRGFDIFMKAAKKICTQHPDVLFFVVGTDRIAYGGDESYIAPHKSFKDWTMAQDKYDLSKFVFTGRMLPPDLGRLLASSDLHMYLTVPFVLSWSMMDAMSCGAVVLGSSTPPVREMIRDGENGLLANFFDTDELAEKALKVLADPAAYRPLGRAAEEMIARDYSLEAVLPRMLKLYEDAVSRRGAKPKVIKKRAAAGAKVAADASQLKGPRTPFLG
ncbi:MAG: glycosyltransferase [Phycisphaerales bacterium]|nr:glycosyltransferase [Phycisphaerales bacterium]